MASTDFRFQCQACGDIKEQFSTPIGWVWATKRNGLRIYLCQTCHSHFQALCFEKFAKEHRKRIPAGMRKLLFPSPLRKKKQKFVECDVFCATCGEQIDTLVCDEKEKENGYGAALVLGDSRRIHLEETKCSGSNLKAWTYGPWRKHIPKKG